MYVFQLSTDCCNTQQLTSRLLEQIGKDKSIIDIAANIGIKQDLHILFFDRRNDQFSWNH
jgi:hypothetical protein